MVVDRGLQTTGERLPGAPQYGKMLQETRRDYYYPETRRWRPPCASSLFMSGTHPPHYILIRSAIFTLACSLSDTTCSHSDTVFGTDVRTGMLPFPTRLGIHSIMIFGTDSGRGTGRPEEDSFDADSSVGSDDPDDF